jgi:hypothetical protein
MNRFAHTFWEATECAGYQASLAFCLTIGSIEWFQLLQWKGPDIPLDDKLRTCHGTHYPKEEIMNGFMAFQGTWVPRRAATARAKGSKA